MWAIIGGSGFENFSEFEQIEEYGAYETPFGLSSSGLKRVKWNGQECLFLSRHGADHELLPSEINFKANIYSLKSLGAKGVLSFSAVGSLREDLEPEDLVFVDQYIDFTKMRGPQSTFCGQGSVGHKSFAFPVEPKLVEHISQYRTKFPFRSHYGKTYVCVEGPRFSSRAESFMFRSWGADVIGMTNMPEAYLALEAGLLYLPFCFVTDFDCWKDDEEPVNLEIVKGRMKNNYSSAKEVINLLIGLELFSDFPVESINSDIFSGESLTWLN